MLKFVTKNLEYRLQLSLMSDGSAHSSLVVEEYDIGDHDDVDETILLCFRNEKGVNLIAVADVVDDVDFLAHNMEPLHGSNFSRAAAEIMDCMLINYCLRMQGMVCMKAGTATSAARCQS